MAKTPNYGYPLKNYVINGNFDIWQRGTSFDHSVAAFTYGADRWGKTYGYSVAAMSRQTFTAGGAHPGNSTYVMRVGGNGSTNTWMNGGHPIESSTTKLLKGKTVTLSGFIRFSAASWSVNPSSFSLTFSGSSLSADSAFATNGYVGAGAASVAWYQGTFPTVWTKFSMTMTVLPTANNLALQWSLGATGAFAVGDWFELSQVQLNEGPDAQPFQLAGGTIGGELALCQRYFWYFHTSTVFLADAMGLANSATVMRTMIKAPTAMRSAPTVNLGNATVSGYEIFSSGATTSVLTTPAAVSIGYGGNNVYMELTGTGLNTGAAYAIRCAGGINDWTFDAEL